LLNNTAISKPLPKKDTKKLKRIWLRTLYVLLVLYIACGVFLYFLQDYLLFHPVVIKKNVAFSISSPYTEKEITTSSNQISCINLLPTDSGKVVVFYFHGNMHNVERYAPYVQCFTKNGAFVIMPDYPTYGKSTGKLTEENLYEMALAVYDSYDSLCKGKKIIVYGKSLGTGIASYLSTKRTVNALILETPYYSLTSVAKNHVPIYPVTWLLKYEIPSYKYIEQNQVPTIIFHGDKDNVIPLKNANKLKQVLDKNDQFILLKGCDHWNVNKHLTYFSTIDSIMKTL
jgi:uncharacterized protein